MKKKVMPDKKPKSHYIPFKYVVVFHSVIIGLALWFLKPPLFFKGESGSDLPPQETLNANLKMTRGNDYQFIRPVRLVDVEKESSFLKPVKEKVQFLLNEKIKSGSIINGAVYLRDLDNGGWIGINNNDKYKAGSIHKVSILIYYLKRAEKEPGILKKEVLFDKRMKISTHETFADITIEPGKSYSIMELLERMIEYSDNDATKLLLRNLENAAAYQKVFTDLGLAKPDPANENYALTAEEISKFMRVLYNSTYLTPEYSEIALKMLSKSSFKEGIIKQLPANLKVAHKFGESGDVNQPQFSEIGIIYTNTGNYLLTVMTKGTDVKHQAETISEISKSVFESINSH